MGSVVMRDLVKHTCGSLWNSIIPLNLDFIPHNQIVNMSLNDLRRRVATHDKNKNGNQMDEPSIALDTGHHVSTTGAPLMLFCFPKKKLLQDL